jgi:ABC-type lipoprotein release transport system permease subunit
LFGAEGRVAAESLFRSPTRTGVTIAAIALVLTVAITAASISLSLQRSIASYFLGGFLAADITVSAVATEGGWLESPIPDSLTDEVAAVDGVASVELLRILPGQSFRGERIALAGLSDGLFDPKRYPSGWYRAGDPVTAAVALRAGKGVNVSTSLADRFGLHVGDTVDLDTPSRSRSSASFLTTCPTEAGLRSVAACWSSAGATMPPTGSSYLSGPESHSSA